MQFHTTHQVRVYTNSQGHAHLERVLRECAVLYNAALEEWRTAYKTTGKSPSMYDQMKQLTQIRAEDEFWGSISVQVGRGVLQRAERARNAFYRRVKRGEAPGYPRYKSRHRWRTVEVAQPSPSMVKNDSVNIVGLPRLRIRRSSREMPDSKCIKSLSVTKRGRRIYAQIGYVVERELLPPSDKIVGIDMGVSDGMALSTGERVGRRRKPDARLKRAQLRLSRCKKGSRRWWQRRTVLSNQQYRERVRNRNECHRITTSLVRRFGLIAVEDLQVKNMVRSARGTVEQPGRNVSQKAGLNRSIQEQTWGIIKQQLAYKAEWAGREVVMVDPKYTSQTCSRCGMVDAASRQGKSYACQACGMLMDADTNASVNILRKAVAAGNSPPPS